METSGTIVVGKPQVNPAAAAHSRGVREGNQRGSLAHEPGLMPMGVMAQATMRRSTGINARAHAPIDPRMPVLTPP
jgi:hypothetical protein